MITAYLVPESDFTKIGLGLWNNLAEGNHGILANEEGFKEERVGRYQFKNGSRIEVRGDDYVAAIKSDSDTSLHEAEFALQEIVKGRGIHLREILVSR